MPLFVRGKDIQSEKVIAPGGGHFETKMVYGKSASLMYAVRPGGYHSKPHIHNCEQLNYVLDGEIWVFIENDCFLVQTGDFYRIPAMAVHWGWNRSDRPCTIIEVHAPPLAHPHMVPLAGSAEALDTSAHQRNYLVSDQYLEAEKRLLANQPG
jgi:mannose-6-phosphate isomerase-like protein (cupin superfamily)